MGRDNPPKERQKARDLHRKAARRQPFERLLIVCEGAKTEPLYLGEIRRAFRLATAHVQVWSSADGTEPLQVVGYAERLFLEGDRSKAIDRLGFDRVIAVFDRDDHSTYQAALAKVRALTRALMNDEGEPVPFQAIASVPCFELWLLLHFEDVMAPVHRRDVFARLRGHLPTYEKGQGGHFAATRHLLDAATARATARAGLTTAHDGREPYTDMHTLVNLLMTLKGGAPALRAAGDA
jgi:RloB-like protein